MRALPGVIAVVSYRLGENGVVDPLSQRVSCLLRRLYALTVSPGHLSAASEKFVSSFISVNRQPRLQDFADIFMI